MRRLSLKSTLFGVDPVCFQAANGKSQNARKKIKILDAWKRRKDADKKAVARLERVELPTL